MRYIVIISAFVPAPASSQIVISLLPEGIILAEGVKYRLPYLPT
jgi:hypothetical protein